MNNEAKRILEELPAPEFTKFNKDKRVGSYRRRSSVYRKRHPENNEYARKFKPNHPCADKQGYMYEHRLVYEESRNCCLLSWVNIHHRDRNKKNNIWYNLEAMTIEKHRSLHHKGASHRLGKFLIPDDRRCCVCGSGESYDRHWTRFGEDIVCSHCRDKIRYHS